MTYMIMKILKTAELYSKYVNPTIIAGNHIKYNDFMDLISTMIKLESEDGKKRVINRLENGSIDIAVVN